MIKCKCGVELFDTDIVYKKYGDILVADLELWRIYRCPKCFKVKKVKL